MADPAFEWTEDEIRRVGHRVADLIARHLARLPGDPAFRPFPAALADELAAAPAPIGGASPDEVLDAFAREIEPYPFGNGHPRFYGWVNPPPSPMGIFGAALAAAMNPSVAGGNHAAVHLERQVAGWFKELVGFPADSMGLLVSGGSHAALTALAVARHRACRRRGWDLRATGLQGIPAPLVVYKGAEGHGCHQKAVELLGLGSDNLRVVPSDGELRMDPAALDALVAEDLAAGRVPVAAIASAGTVNTGAVDPLGPLADVCARRGVWLHVDGAYGAPAILDEGCAAALRPMARADSLAVDPHKWLYVPVDAGVVLVRDAAAMRDTFSLVPPYLRTDGDERGVQGPPWFSEFGMEQTRSFRALKIWMALRHLGLSGYRALVARDLAAARRLAERVRAAPDLVLWEPQGLSIVCFRHAGAGGGGEALDDLNRAVLRDIQLGGAAFLSSTVMAGRFWLRACIVNPRARLEDMDALVELVRAAARRRLGG
ncbi:MAG TPA: pyridoxal-dependent decarboxylase [Anaeromyxobacteraceae bacterium]|jgi:glutamate/tyrosine decarboxylase-like PLP-dependent enzyme